MRSSSPSAIALFANTRDMSPNISIFKNLKYEGEAVRQTSSIWMGKLIVEVECIGY